LEDYEKLLVVVDIVYPCPYLEGQNILATMSFFTKENSAVDPSEVTAINP